MTTEQTDLKIEQYERKSFPVEAVRVTAANIEAVAQWCDGTIRTEDENATDKAGEQYIKVQVETPLTPRQTMAFVGDWVLFAGKGFKVYKDKPFRKSFDRARIKRVIEPVRVPAKHIQEQPADAVSAIKQEIAQNVFEGEGVQPGAGESSFSATASNNPGGGHKLG